MAVKSLMPFFGNRQVTRGQQDADPLQAFRGDMNRLFDDFFSSFPLPGLLAPQLAQVAQVTSPMLTPRIDVSETEQDIRISAELPGLDGDDVEVVLTDDLLTIRGEKSAERKEDEDDERGYHVMERTEGMFSRSLRLPFKADPDQVQASFRNGVLTVTIPKPAEAQQRTRRIDVKRDERDEGTGGAKVSSIDRAAAGDKPGSSEADQKASATAGEAKSGTKGDAPKTTTT
jgi:HSP20 family protein